MGVRLHFLHFTILHLPHKRNKLRPFSAQNHGSRIPSNRDLRHASPFVPVYGLKLKCSSNFVPKRRSTPCSCLSVHFTKSQFKGTRERQGSKWRLAEMLITHVRNICFSFCAPPLSLSLSLSLFCLNSEVISQLSDIPVKPLIALN